MELEIQRCFILVLPYVFSTTLAAFLLWGEDLRKHFRLFVIFTIVSSLTQTLTYQIHLESIRFLCEVFSGYLVFWAVFRGTHHWNFRIYATSYLLGIVATMLSLYLLPSLTGTPLSQCSNSLTIWLWQDMLVMPLVVLAGWMVHYYRNIFENILLMLRYQFSSIFYLTAAIGLQIVVFTSLLGQHLQLLNGTDINFHIHYLLFFALYLLSLVILVRFIYLVRRDIDQDTQQNISDSMLEMIISVRGQRHDFSNQLQIIDGLNQQQRYRDLHNYVRQLMNDTTCYSEILKTDNPIISALINAKLGQAKQKGVKLDIDLQTDLTGLSKYSMDVSRILGNLIDNALEAVETGDNKQVCLKICREGPLVVISVRNPVPGDMRAKEKWMSPGFSTKGSGHSGIGLAISRLLARKIDANLSWQIEAEGWVVFRLVLPAGGRPQGKNEPLPTIAPQRLS